MPGKKTFRKKWYETHGKMDGRSQAYQNQLASEEAMKACQEFFECAVTPEMIGVKPLAPYYPSKTEHLVSPVAYGIQPQQEGINPMFTEKNKTTAVSSAFTINAAEQPTEASIQRDYLLSRLEGLKSRFEDMSRKIRNDLRKQFNLDAKDLPSDPTEFVRLLKKGDITLDDKRIAKLKARAESLDEDEYGDDELDETGTPDIFRYHSLTSFLIWKDAPKADRKGYDAASAAYAADFQRTKDIIMTSPADGLDAIYALENWTLKGSKSVH